MKYPVAKHAIIAIFIFSLLLLGFPLQSVFAADPMPKCDAWTDRGGKGSLEASGGTFVVGEEIVIYTYINMPGQVVWQLWGPQGKEREERYPANAAGQYTIDIGRAEEKDVGKWQINFAIYASQYVCTDIMPFTIIAPSTPLPSATTTQPLTPSTPGNTVVPQTLGGPTSLLTSEEWAALLAEYPIADPKPSLKEQRENIAQTELQTSGLPVLAAFIMYSENGDNVLVVVLDFDKLPSEKGVGGFITAAVKALLKVASTKTLDLSTISYVTVALQDSKERVFIEAGVQSTDIDDFRTGKIDQSKFVKQTAIQIKDRFAAWSIMLSNLIPSMIFNIIQQ